MCDCDFPWCFRAKAAPSESPFPFITEGLRCAGKALLIFDAIVLYVGFLAVDIAVDILSAK